MARPKLNITDSQVEAVARLHCTYDEMAAVLHCSVDTLERRFADVVKSARENAKTSLRRAQWVSALKGDRTMLIWLGKQYLGQSDMATTQLQLTGAGGGPLQIMDVSELNALENEARTDLVAAGVAAVDRASLLRRLDKPSGNGGRDNGGTA